MKLYRYCVLLFLPIILGERMLFHASNISCANRSFDSNDGAPLEDSAKRVTLPEQDTSNAQVARYKQQEDAISWAIAILKTPKEGRLGLYGILGRSKLTQEPLISDYINAGSPQEALKIAKTILNEQNNTAVWQN